ncbi:hypothetical protein ES332_A06G079900v1 [Gossypium tomentosum]|uniref:CENP-V/GFA domain-containing protein n=1 Tax=Gossypium tomentosum TaxID=34277 RepID=A0A5D2Q3V3_GOSTO|nr:hypothetical protein ES332_A06G079900v1 [Gossypium tomentosum]
MESPSTTSVIGWKFNCSDYSIRGNVHFVFITTYTFGTHTAKHTFCKFCGKISFYTPGLHPDGIAVTLAYLNPTMLSHVEIRNFENAVI